MHSEDIDENFVRRAAALLAGIELTAAQVPGVVDNLRRTVAIAAAVNEFRLDPVDEPGPVWRL